MSRFEPIPVYMSLMALLFRRLSGVLRWVSMGVCWPLWPSFSHPCTFARATMGHRLNFYPLHLSFSSSPWSGDEQSSARREGGNKKWLRGPVKAPEIAQVRSHLRALFLGFSKISTRDEESELHRLWGLVWASWEEMERKREEATF